MFVTAFALAASAAPPPDVDLQAVETWQARATRLRRGPDSCWDLEGTARHQIAVFRPPTLFGRSQQTDYVYTGTFRGRLDQGTWTGFTAEMKPASPASVEAVEEERGVDWKIPVRPLVGRAERSQDEDRRRRQARGDDDTDDDSTVDGQSSATEAVTLIDQILDAVDADVTTTYVEWSDEDGGLFVVERYPLSDRTSGKGVDLRTFFPQGSEVGTRLDVMFPRKHRVGDFPLRITLLRPQLHVRTQALDGESLPTYESLSLAAGAVGFTVGFEQELRYTRATACVSSPDE